MSQNQNQKLRDQTREQRQYLNALNQKLDQLTLRVAHLGETLAAIVSHLGEDVIVSKMQDMRDVRKRKREEELEQGVQFLLDNGLATATAPDSTIDANSFIVIDEVDSSGTATRYQHEMQRLDQSGQARYIGKKVGDEITVPGFDSKNVVRAIYTLDFAKIQAHTAKKKAEAAAKTLATGDATQTQE
jgi:hypothetical protein